ncbi:GspH/FimT family pseudopilin [Stutzerimonas stutzeri]|uniref:GspH/FimT family pseudopilin n=1 Tax=Stutzerimonas stutzeri TaxID=316 RepID=UPI0014834B3B|nr:GspH/FimT family pseudopilin [Stutzerimonas stutzeri]WQN29390.1 GspH/FimT family pseudopilin [Stutzerimonas stutzeri]
MMKQQAGFTLIELMVAVALLGIVLAIAIPAINDFTIKQRVSSQAHEMMLSLALARSEALKLNRDVRVIPQTGTASGWSDGWCVGPATIGSNCNHADVIRLFRSARSVSITSFNTANPPRFSFRRDGTREGNVNAALKVTSPNLDATGESARCITLSPLGRAEIAKVSRDAGC